MSRALLWLGGGVTPGAPTEEKKERALSMGPHKNAAQRAICLLEGNRQRRQFTTVATL